MPARPDPFRNYNFTVDFGGQAVAGFSEAHLPAAFADVIEYREGGDRHARKLPGRIHFTNLVLRRGITTSDDLYQWWRTVENGQAERRDLQVTLLDDARTPVKRWRFQNTWPARFESPDLDARGSDVVIETLEIVVEGMEIE
jgi:phage tail-like protein